MWVSGCPQQQLVSNPEAGINLTDRKPRKFWQKVVSNLKMFHTSEKWVKNLDFVSGKQSSYQQQQLHH